MDWSAAPDVVFDYEGSLQLARRLWTFADAVESARSVRESDAEGPLKSWLGPLVADFTARMDNESTSLSSAANALRSEATAWGAMWQSAVNEQQRINHARECKRIEEDRSGAAKFFGGLFGHNDLPPAPDPVPTPTGPGFHVERTHPRSY